MLMLLRAVACIGVIYGHALTQGVLAIYPRPKLLLWGHDVTNFLLTRGDMWVMVFFVLSGYLMGKGFWSGRYARSWQGAVRFYRSRAVRIMPLYYVSVVIVALAVYPGIFANWRELWPLLFFNYHYFPLPVNGPLWSISTEMQFYALAPLIAAAAIPLVKARKDAVIAIVVVILLYAGLRAYYYYGVFDGAPVFGSKKYWEDYYYPFLPYIGMFLSGFMLNGLLHFRTGQLRFAPIIQRVLLLLLIVYIGLWTHVDWFGRWSIPKETQEFYTFCVAPFVIIAFVASIIYFAEHADYALPREPLSLHALRQNPWRAGECIGVLTYGMYVWHQPMLDLVKHCTATTLHPFARLYFVFTVTLLLTTIAAIITYYGAEKPAERYVARRINPRAPTRGSGESPAPPPADHILPLPLGEGRGEGS